MQLTGVLLTAVQKPCTKHYAPFHTVILGINLGAPVHTKQSTLNHNIFSFCRPVASKKLVKELHNDIVYSSSSETTLWQTAAFVNRKTK
jgi:hypothetical protein